MMNYFWTAIIACLVFIVRVSAFQLNVSYATNFAIFNSTPEQFWVENRYLLNLTCEFIIDPGERAYILEWFIGGRIEYQWIIPSVSQFFNEWDGFDTKADSFYLVSQNASKEGLSAVSTVAFSTGKVDYVCAVVYQDTKNVVRIEYKSVQFRK